MHSSRIQTLAATLLFLFASSGIAADGLVAHWKLAGNAQDSSGHNRHAINHGVTWDSEGNAVFDGRKAWLEIPAKHNPQ